MREFIPVILVYTKVIIMPKTGHKKMGWILIALGIFFVLQYVLDWDFYWATVMIVVGGVLLVYAIVSGTQGGVFPGTLLFLLGLFLLLRETGVLDDPMEDQWPLILIILGFSFVITFLFRPQEWGILIPGGILMVIGLLFFLRNYRYISWHTMHDILRWWPLILVAVGAWMLLRLKHEPRE